MPNFDQLHNSLPPLIGVVGNIRAGKTTVCAHLAHQHGFSVASNSDLLKEIAVKLQIPTDRESLKKIGDAIFSTLGNDAIAKYRVSNQTLVPTIIDGIRYSEEVEIYRKTKNFRLIAITAPDDVRYSRANMLIQNGEGKDAARSFDEFMALSSARSEEKVPHLMKLADFVIENNGSIEDLKSKIDSALLQIGTFEDS